MTSIDTNTLYEEGAHFNLKENTMIRTKYSLKLTSSKLSSYILFDMFGGHICQETVGIPMVIDFAPHPGDLFLCFQSLFKENENTHSFVCSAISTIMCLLCPCII